jgi:hypothetical protein
MTLVTEFLIFMRQSHIFRVILILFLGFSAHQVARAELSPVTPSQCRVMKEKGVLAEHAPVGCERLRNVSFLFQDFSGQIRTGRVLVLDAVSRRVQRVFDALYARHFPLGKAVLLEDYHGDDNASMTDNNSSGFNARPLTGGTLWSLHAYGVAIDINPVQNPYVSFASGGLAHIVPAAAAPAGINRLKYRPDKAERSGMAEEVIDLFADNGFFAWGGYWNEPVDYQHFDIGSRSLAVRMLSLSPAQAEQLFEQQIRHYRDCMAGAPALPHEKARALCLSQR